MSPMNFTYLPVDEDTNCPFCGAHIPQGASVCGGCQATHGRSVHGAVNFTLPAALFVTMIVGIQFLSGIESKEISWGIGIAVFLASAIGFKKLFARMFTSEGWFR